MTERDPLPPQRRACPCGQFTQLVPGGSAAARELADADMAEHKKTCSRASEPWTLKTLDAETLASRIAAARKLRDTR